MPRLTPLKYRELISKLKKLGLTGPYPGSKHPYFLLGGRPIKIPNPHEGDVGKDIIKDILRLIGITWKEFSDL